MVELKKRKWLIVFAAVYLTHTLSSLAHAGLILGATGGYSLNEGPSGYYSTIGGRAASGISGIGTNTTVYRDVSKTFKGLSYGASLGYVGKSLGFDVRGRRIVGTGKINRYSRGTGSVTIANGDATYSTVMVDFGVRWYPARWLYLRPHLGQALNPTYKYEFGTRPINDSDSESKNRLTYGAGLFFVIGGKTLRFEVGVDYNRYNSAFSGTAQELVALVSPTFYFGSKK